MASLYGRQILKRNFGSMEIKHRNYTAVLAALTPNAYLMVVSVDPGVRTSSHPLVFALPPAQGTKADQNHLHATEPAGILLNIQLSSEKFAKLQTATLLG